VTATCFLYRSPRLKRIVAQQAMDMEALKELLSKKMVTPPARKAGVAYLREAREYSERKGCALVGISRCQRSLKTRHLGSNQNPPFEMKWRISSLQYCKGGMHGKQAQDGNNPRNHRLTGAELVLSAYIAGHFLRLLENF